ncbi:MAG TPA: POTRA domain-containing protein [Candidatus Angelobacter sp.]|nr:POTRA domain-containing protein [Candidatus Angelobacter sp.]
MPSLRPVCLRYLLWLGVLAALQVNVALAQQSAVPKPTPASDQEISGNLNSLQGVNVESIQITGSSVEHPEWLEPLLVQKVNQPLDKYKVRDSVQALYKTGRFASIQVEAKRSSPGAIALTFSTEENFFFGSILAPGAPSRPSEGQLVNASRLGLGERFTEPKIESGKSGMQRALQEGGYFQATIVPYYEWDTINQQVKVRFVVVPGKSARVGEVQSKGPAEITSEEIRKITKLKQGKRVTAGQATKALQRMRSHLQKKGRLEAQVTLTERVYHPQNNALDYTFDIIPGPVVDVRVEGAKLRRGRMKKLIPIFEENAVDEDLLNEGRRNLTDYFQTKGYFDVRVSVDQKQVAEGKRQVIFHVDKGDRHKFENLTINGNQYFRREDIRERMQMQPAGGWLQNGLFSQAILARDITAIENLYRSNGFLHVKVTPQVTDNYKGQTGHIQVVLNIAEGQQTIVGKLIIEGNTALSETEIRSLIATQEGQPYADATIISDQTEVMNAYANRGFPDVRVDYSTTLEPDDPTRVDVTYTITEGQQVFVNRVLLSGLHFTKPFVAAREMKIVPGKPLSQREMLDSQNSLYGMGIFNEVNMAVQNPDGQATHKNVNFQLTEAKRYTFNYGLGLEVQTGQPGGATNPQGKTGVSPRVSFDITRLNFRGRNHTLILKTRYGTLEQLALLGYTAPRWFDAPQLTLDFTAFYQLTNNVQTYTAARIEGAVEVKQRVSRTTTLLYRLIYRRVETSNLVINPDQVPLFSQPVRVGFPDFAYIRDSRDNPIDSHKGSFNTFDIGVASRIFGSQPNFVRISAQNSTYYQFHKHRWVFARSTRIGTESPFAGTSAAIAAPGPGAPPPSSFIPLPERFLSGGPTTLRGFGINQAGPRDLSTGQPLGGEALFINNLELRSPTFSLPYIGRNVSVVIFNDVGNVFTTPSAMWNNLYKFSQPNRNICLNPAAATCDFNYMSAAVGGGIRYRTPVGPLSFDVGYNLNPPAFPVSAPPPATPPVAPFSQVLRRFNFFFNIGQTF